MPTWTSTSRFLPGPVATGPGGSNDSLTVVEATLGLPGTWLVAETPAATLGSAITWLWNVWPLKASVVIVARWPIAAFGRSGAFRSIATISFDGSETTAIGL